MEQEVLNVFIIFILPFLLGIIIRLLCQRTSKGWITSIVVVVITIIVAVLAITGIGGNRETLAIYMCIMVFVTLGSLLTGLVLIIISRLRNN